MNKQWIHITPAYSLENAIGVELVDVTLPELGIQLQKGKDLRCEFMAECAIATGQSMTHGILLEDIQMPAQLVVRARWRYADTLRIHQVTYIRGDQDYEGFTTDPSLWCAPLEDAGKISDMPEGNPPIQLMAKMELSPNRSSMSGDKTDIVNDAGSLIERWESQRIPSINPQTLYQKLCRA